MMFDPAALDLRSGKHLLLTVDKQFVRTVVAQFLGRLDLALLTSGLGRALGGLFPRSRRLAAGFGPIGRSVSAH